MKIKSLPAQRPVNGQQGMASIVVVSVLIIVMTLISLGFARLVSRTAINSANRQFSSSATYAAQSAINDVAAYLKQYAAANPGSSFLPKSTKCSGAGSLIGTSASPGPFYNDSNLSGDSTTKFTCLLLNPTPTSLVYTQVASLKSQVVKVNTSATAGALNKLMISWQPSNTQITGYPLSASSLNDQTTWNSSTGVCKDSSSANAICIPMLRLSIFPVANGSVISGTQTKSKTVFLYPQSPTGNVPVRPFTDNTNLADGALIPVSCTQSVGATDFNPATNSDYKCNIIISALSGAIAPANTDSVYLRLTPIYNQADIKIAANDKFGSSLNFIGDQAVIDVTAQTGGVAKRLQARVNTSSLAVGAGGISSNISSSSNSIPEQSVRAANALCKRVVQTTTSAGFASFVNFDDPDNVCHDLAGTTAITNPVPTLTFNITGNNGQDSGKTVDSEANNPDLPQSPIQQGTVYVGSPGVPGSITLNWNTTDATSCTAAGGWSGEKNGLMSFTGSPPTNGTGAPQTFSGINSVTEYDLTCSRPFAPSTTPTKKVFAWPYPTASVSGPSSVNAGDNYTVSWSSGNTKANGCVLGGVSWTDPSDTRSTGSQTMNWPWSDSSSSRSFTVTCYDPINRSATSNTWTVSPGGGGSTQVNPPSCSGSASITSNGGWHWEYQASCPLASPASGGYHVNTTNLPELPSGDVPASLANSGYRGSISSRGANKCIQIIAWVPGWGSAASPNFTSPMDCKDVFDPVVISHAKSNQFWDQGPAVCSSAVAPAYQGTWRCRNNVNVVNPNNLTTCADGVHRFTMCGSDLQWQASGGNGSILCAASTATGVYASGSALRLGGGETWGWDYNPNSSSKIHCSDSAGTGVDAGPPGQDY